MMEHVSVVVSYALCHFQLSSQLNYKQSTCLERESCHYYKVRSNPIGKKLLLKLNFWTRANGIDWFLLSSILLKTFVLDGKEWKGLILS